MHCRSRFPFHRFSQLALIVGAVTTAIAGSAEAWDSIGGTWSGRPATITYSYSNLLDGNLQGLTNGELRLAVEEALNIWAMHAPLNFVERTDSGPMPTTADSDYSSAGHPTIRFGHHALSGNTAGHAWSPPGTGYSINGLGGDVHLDNSSRTWGLYFDNVPRSEILGTLIHEIGHALGLDHVTNVPAMMHPGGSGDPYNDTPYYGSGTAFLFPDDISGIRARYGTGVGSVRPLAPAQTRSWTNASAGNLLTNANWSGGIALNAKGSTAVIDTALTNSGNFTLNDAMTLGTLTYNNPGGRSINGTGTLRFWANSGNALFHTTANSGYLDPSIARIILTTSTEFRIQGSTRVDISSPISGSGNLAKTGSQELLLKSNNSTYRGVTSISGGVLSGAKIANNGTSSSFGVGNFSISGGATLRYTGVTDFTNRTISLGSGNGWLDVTESGTVLTAAGVISGSGGLGKIGAGRLKLNATNTYTGSTTIAEGILQIGASERIPNASSVTITGGTFYLNGFSETISGLYSTSGTGVIELNGGTLSATGPASVTNGGVLFIRNAHFSGEYSNERFNALARMDIDNNGRLELPLGGWLSARKPSNSNDAFYIGNQGVGTFNQSGGRLDVIGNTWVGIGAGEEFSRYNHSAGDAYLNGNVFIARDGKGVWDHLGTGNAGITGDLVLGQAFQGTGYYYKTGSGSTTLLASGTGSGPGHLVVGRSGGGWVESSNGPIRAVQLRMGENQNSSGTFYNKEIATLEISELIQIGIAGTGLLNVQGGSVSTTTGSITLGVAATGDGTLRASGGGVVTTNQTIVVGNLGKGLLAVSGNATVSANALSLGRGPDAQATVEQYGGTLNTTGAALLGDFPGVTTPSTFTKSGGLLTVGEQFRIGDRSSAMFTQNGGITIAGRSSAEEDVVVGNASGGSGVFTISGGDFTTYSDLVVGKSGVGTVVQSDTARVRIDGDLRIASGVSSAGTYTLSGGDLDVSQGAIQFGDGLIKQFNFTGGTLSVGTFNGDLDNQGGTLAHDNWDSTTTILGDYQQDTLGVLEFVIAPEGNNPIFVQGSTYLDGNLAVSLLEGFDPIGLSYNILNTQGTLSGPLVDLANSPAEHRIDTLEGLGSFRLTVITGGVGAVGGPQLWLDDFQYAVATLAGDFDLDGDVDGRDFLAWQRDPSIGDLVDWQTNYGDSTPALSGVANVPEPTSMMIFLGAVLVAFSKRNGYLAYRIVARDRHCNVL